MVGIGGWLEPRALGVGYDVIGDLLHGNLALQVVVAILAVKAVMWVVALGSGTSGGVLAPLLMLGAGLGTLLGAALPGTDPALWPLVCMAATLGATLGAPLTAVVFAFGLTHDANALLPLLAATLVAHGFSALVMRRSIMTEKIARRGYHIYREYGVDPLERHDVADVMTRDAVAIDAHATIAATRLAQFGADQRHRAYPVLRDGVLLAMLDRARLDALDAAHGGQATLEAALRGVSPGARAAERNLPAGGHAAGRARARAAAGARRSGFAAPARHRLAQRPGQAGPAPFRRGAQARALPCDAPDAPRAPRRTGAMNGRDERRASGLARHATRHAKIPSGTEHEASQST